MPSQPETVNDRVLYSLSNIHADQNITIRLLDGSTLEIWGTAFYNGNPLTTIGSLPIATQPEAEAGVDNTKVMTPLRVSQAIDVQATGGGGPGAVTSVNGETGVVVLNQDEVLDGTTYKQYSQTEKTKLAGVATGATANATDAQLRDRSTHTGTQSADTVVDGTTNHVFTAADDTKLTGIAAGATVGPTQEQVEDYTAALFAAGTHTNATVTYNDTTPSLSIAATGGVSDTVWVGTSAPVDANIELWWDTDEAAVPIYGLESAKPTTPATPLRYFATDTKRDWMYDGTGWIVMGEPTQTYTPTLVNVTLGTGGSTTGTYHRSDGWCDFYCLVALGTGGTLIAQPSISFPFTAGMFRRYQFAVNLHDNSTNNYRGLNDEGSAGATAFVPYSIFGSGPTEAAANLSATVPFTWTVNDAIRVVGRYQMNSRYT